jgi:ABC-type antimicrobial peptide transport system permease subunit
MVVGFATLATTFLVFILSIRLRKREIITIHKIDGPKRRINAILATEIIIVISVSILLSILLTIIINQVEMEIVGRWLS